MYRILNINIAKNPGKFCLLLLAAALLACNKNTEKADVRIDPVVVPFDGVVPVSGMRVFTAGGMILDPAIDKMPIENYLARNYSLKKKYRNPVLLVKVY